MGWSKSEAGGGQDAGKVVGELREASMERTATLPKLVFAAKNIESG